MDFKEGLERVLAYKFRTQKDFRKTNGELFYNALVAFADLMEPVRRKLEGLQRICLSFYE